MRTSTRTLVTALAVVAMLVGCKDRNASGVPVASGQSADLVLGEPDFTTGNMDSVRGTPTANGMGHPSGVSTDGAHLWVSDATNNRVMQWNAIPTANNANADVFIGQVDATKRVSGASATSFVGGISTCASVTQLFVSDLVGNRVLIFPMPTTNLPVATVVLGQSSFTTTAAGKSASELNGPTDLWTDGTRLVVVDSGNSRVLIWNTIPTTNGQAADLVLGRSTFGLGASDTPADPPTSSSMKAPYGVWSNGTRVYVADSGNNRVLVWNAFPTTSGTSASIVLGQSAFDQNAANANQERTNPIGFNKPRKAIEANGALFTSDALNHRVVVHYPLPTVSGIPAVAVLGQDTLHDSTQPTRLVNDRFIAPGLITADHREVFVPDYGFNRVLRFHVGR